MSTISSTEYETRIQQLEKLNSTLAAEIDRMRPVVEAALQWHSLSKYLPEHYLDHEQNLANAIHAYEGVNILDESDTGGVRCLA